ncbi:MAG: DUF5989 family protein [Limisphaerales bacterium]|jgi:CHASE1-domain containing sensor protein
MDRHLGRACQAPSSRSINALAKSRLVVIVCAVWQVFLEFLQFLKQEKKWWLWPLILMLLLLGALIAFSSSSALAPFMYPFM